MFDQSLRLFNFFGFCFLLVLALGQLAIKKKNFRQWLFAGFYFSIAMMQLSNVNVDTNLHYTFPQLSLIDLPFLFSTGPFLYLLLKDTIQKGANLEKRHLKHFILPGLVFLATLPYYLASADSKRERLLNAFVQRDLMFHESLYIIGLVVLFIYIIMILRSSSSVFNFQIFKEEVSVQHISWVIAASCVVIILALLAIFLQTHIFFRLSSALITLSICLIFIVGHRYPNFYQNFINVMSQAKYRQSHLGKLNVQDVIEKLENLMYKEKIYQTEELSLSTLAEHLDINSHQLSQLLNEVIKMNFSSYVNKYRIEEAKELLLKDPTMNVLSIAYQVGFNSKPSFNRAFSQLTGITPKEYRQRGLK